LSAPKEGEAIAGLLLEMRTDLAELGQSRVPAVFHTFCRMDFLKDKAIEDHIRGIGDRESPGLDKSPVRAEYFLR
jgi:hypothetical protein